MGEEGGGRRGMDVCTYIVPYLSRIHIEFLLLAGCFLYCDLLLVLFAYCMIRLQDYLRELGFLRPGVLEEVVD
jgi:hypothetical protein